jgi:predicted anti-sigma-YlaC factor YlaD
MLDPNHRYEHGYTCEEVVELTAEFVDGAMSPAQMTQFEMHLNFCDGCFYFVDQIRETAGLARRADVEQIPEDTKAKLVQAFRDWRSE